MASHDPRFSITVPDSSYSYQSTQGPPQPIRDITTPASDGIVPGYQDPRTFGIPYPIRGMIAEVLADGTMKVYGPPLYRVGPNGLEWCEESPYFHIGPDGPEFPLLSHEDSRVKVPQHPYTCGNTQKEWRPKPAICFFTWERLGVKLTDALDGKFNGMNNRDDFPFGEDCRGITIRMHFFGYSSSTDVEKVLKQLAGDRKGSKARSMQLSTKNYKVPPEPVTKSKLVQEVSKRIKWHITDLKTNSSLFPFNDQVDEQWRLGQGRMKLEHMVVAGLVNVSSGSWSPILCLE